MCCNVDGSFLGATSVRIPAFARRSRRFVSKSPVSRRADLPWFSEDDMTWVSVCAMSATISQGFLYDTNSRASRVDEHETPFANTNKEVALYLPGGTELVGKLTSPGYNGRPKFDLRLHAPWARDEALRLIRANDGRALVLCATSRDGRAMAERLADSLAGTGIRVFSQWDGQPIPRIAEKWREDERSVLVGTKSLMTGIDAPGQTCSLVIIDRPRGSRRTRWMKRALSGSWTVAWTGGQQMRWCTLRMRRWRWIRQRDDSCVRSIAAEWLLRSILACLASRRFRTGNRPVRCTLDRFAVSGRKFGVARMRLPSLRRSTRSDDGAFACSDGCCRVGCSLVHRSGRARALPDAT